MTEDNAEIPLFASAMDVIKAAAAMKNVAKTIAAFHKSLVEEGFSPRAALSLCNTWLAAAIQQTGRKR